MPHSLHPLLESGILLAAISAVVLNMYFNGFKSAAEAEAEVRGGAAMADAAH